MDMFDVFRVNEDGSVRWIGSANSARAAREMTKAILGDRSERFLIHDYRTNETLTIRSSDSLDSLAKAENPVTSILANSHSSSPD